ncbi:MAG: trimeric intracellular cation channel family protein [Pseudomonadota bacterium]
MLTLAYLIAITAEAMTGALAAGRRNMDLFGVSLIAFLTALGGGTVRDILLGNFPVNWTQHPEYVYLTIGAGLSTMLIVKLVHKLQQLFLVLDAIGLVAFTLIGCNVGQQLGYDSAIVVMAGIITGIFGGILRDLLCDRPPEVLHRELYASVSLLVALLYLQLQQWQLDDDIVLLASFSVGLLLRMCALRWRWQLPTFSYGSDRWQEHKS